jgi:mRNA interferase MazF
VDSGRRLAGNQKAETQVKLGRGAVVVVELDPVLSDPEVISDQRFHLLCVVPVTGTPGLGLLYPALSPGQSGLTKKSFALIDHLRSIDKRRIRRVFGDLPENEIAAVDEGLTAFLGLSARKAGGSPVH